MNNSC